MESFRGGKSSGGLFSGFGFGTGVVMGCKAEDTSFFCRFSRVFNILMMVIILLIIVTFMYGLLAGKASLFGGAMKSIRRGLF